MKVMLVVEWSSSAEPDRSPDDFYKIVDMPALPPVGAEMWLSGYYGFLLGGPFIVSSIRWVELAPSVVEVAFEEQFAGGVDEIREEFLQAGWTQSDYPPGYN